MNSIVKGYYPVFQMYQALRDKMMATLSDDDLAFKPGGDNPTLGSLCREIGQVQQSYIDSFRTLKQDFSQLRQDTELEASVDKLTSWYRKLDEMLKAVIEGLSEEDVANLKIDRGGGFILSPQLQLEVYKEALLIFYGKADVYLKQMGKTPPEQWRHWIA